MATILRYANYLRRSGSIAKRLNTSHSRIEFTSTRLGPQSQRVTRNLTTIPERQSRPIYSYEKSFQNLEVHLRRSGRTHKNDVQKILGEIQLAGTVPSLEALLLVRCCGKPMIAQNSEESIQLVQEIWDTLERLKVPLDVSHYNALLNVYLERDYVFSPAEFLQKMIQKQITPNRVTYHRMIETYCRRGDIANATKIIDMMRTNNFPLCENVFNSLIRGHSEANDLPNAEATLETMKAAGLEPSVDTYVALMCAYAKRGDMSAIADTMNKVETLDMTLLDQHLIDVIETLAINGHTEKAAEFSQKLPKEITSDRDIGRLLMKLMEVKETKLTLEILKNTTTDIARFQVRAGFLLQAAANNKEFTVDEMIALCNTLEDQDLHSRTYCVILYHVLAGNARPSVAIPLMEEWMKRDGSIREHYFWPLLRKASQASDYQSILDILKAMVDKFNVVPTLPTLRDYTIPFMFGTWDQIIGRLVSLGIPKLAILEAIAHRAIKDKKLRNSMMFMLTYPIQYRKELFLQPLADSLNFFDDTKSFVTILKFLGPETSETLENQDVSVALVDEALTAVLQSAPKYRHNIVEKMLSELECAGLSMSPSMAESVTAFLGPDKAAELEPLITKLASGTLTPVPLAEFNSYANNRATEYVKRPSGLSLVDLRTEFANTLESKDADKVLKSLKQLQAQDYQSPAVLAQSLDLFCSTDNLEAAEFCFNQFKEHCKDANLDTVKILSFAALLVKHERLGEAMQVLTDAPDLAESEKLSRGIRNRVRGVLDATTNTKHVENTHQMFNLLKSKNYITFDNYTLGPLVKIHVLRNDHDKAMEVFENMCNQYKCTPFKNALAGVLIAAEDANALQKLTDLCTDIHGESNALVDLAWVFVEAGRPVQARKILETSGIQVFNEKITSVIKHFKFIGKPECVDMLARVTKGVVRIDRAHLYTSLVNFYDSNNDWQKGLALWTDIQEMDLQPTTYFLNTLSTLLSRNQQHVPFTSEPVLRDRQSERVPKRTRVSKTYEGNENFYEALNNKDWTGAESFLKVQARGRREERYLYSELIRAMLTSGDVAGATDLSRAMLKEMGDIPKRLFSLVCNELIDQEKYEIVEDLGSSMTEDIRNDVAYYKILSHARIRRLGIRKYLEELEFDGTDEGYRAAEKKVHFGAMLHALLKEPDFLLDYEKWARELAEQKIFRGMHVLWNYHFLMNNAKEHDLWEEFMTTASSPLVRPIIEISVERKEPLLLKKLTKRMETHPRLHTGTMCRVISGLIKAHVAAGEFDEGLEVLNESTKRYRLSMLALDALEGLKEGLEKSGRAFPYNISVEGRRSEKELEERKKEVRAA